VDQQPVAFSDGLRPQEGQHAQGHTVDARALVSRRPVRAGARADAHGDRMFPTGWAPVAIVALDEGAWLADRFFGQSMAGPRCDARAPRVPARTTVAPVSDPIFEATGGDFTSKSLRAPPRCERAGHQFLATNGPSDNPGRVHRQGNHRRA
jgi:hypothetical protein